MDNYQNEIVGALRARWWALLVRGIAAILLGILVLVLPGSGLLALVFVWGSYAVIDGVFELAVAAKRGRRGARWGWYFFEGLVSIGAGVLAFVWPGITALVLAMMVGAWALLTGVAEIAAAIGLRKVMSGGGLLVASGILSIVFGLVVFAFPIAGALSMVWLFGICAIAFGALLVALSYRVKHWSQQPQKPATQPSHRVLRVSLEGRL